MWPALALLALLACAGIDRVVETPVNLPAEISRLAEPPATVAGAEATPTLTITDIVPTPASEGLAVVVVEEEAAAENYSNPVVPVTGTETEPEAKSWVCAPHRLSNMLTYTIYDRSSGVIGVVDGLVVYLPLIEPAVAAPLAAEQAPVISLPVPRIVYAIADLGDESGFANQDMFLPFGLVAFPPLPAEGISPGGGAGAALPGEVGCNFTLAVDRQVLAENPVVKDNFWETGDFGLDRPGWDVVFRRYWHSQGFPISEEPGRPLILTDFNDAAVTDLEGSSVGRVVDFIVDSQTNRFEYAILSPGGVLSGEDGFFVIPVHMLRWDTVTGSLGRRGDRLTVDAPASLIHDAPSFAGIDVFDVPAGPWRGLVDSFWSSSSLLVP